HPQVRRGETGGPPESPDDGRHLGPSERDRGAEQGGAEDRRRDVRQRRTGRGASLDRKSTRLNSSHVANSYAVFCLKKKNSSIGDSVVIRMPLHRQMAHLGVYAGLP